MEFNGVFSRVFLLLIILTACGDDDFSLGADSAVPDGGVEDAATGDATGSPDAQLDATTDSATPGCTFRWTTSDAILEGFVLDPTLSVDSSNRPHIGYDEAGGKIRHAVLVDGGWSVSTVDEQGGGTSAIAVEAESTKVVYRRLDFAGSLFLATQQNGGAWSTEELIRSIGFSRGRWLDIAVTPGISTTVVYVDGDDNLKYANSLLGGSSSHQVVAREVGENVSLAIDATIKTHVTYFDKALGMLRYALLKTDGSWFTEAVAMGGASHDMAVVGSSVFVVHDDGIGVSVSENTSGSWVTEVISDRPGEVRISGGGLPQIVTLDNDGIRHASQAAGGWSENRIASVENLDSFDIAISGDGVSHLVYTSTAGELTYMTGVCE